MNAVRQLRYQAGLTQALLARISGIDPTTISRYENGHRSPTLEMLERLASAVGLHPVIIFESIESEAAPIDKKRCAPNR